MAQYPPDDLLVTVDIASMETTWTVYIGAKAFPGPQVARPALLSVVIR